MSGRRLALITGGCRRLGARIAVRLAERWDIALHAGHDATLEPGLERALGPALRGVVVADLADTDAVSTLVPRVAAACGASVALLVNNASRFGALDGMPDMGDLLGHLAVNTAAPAALALALAEAGGEAVVNILDQRVANPPRDQLAYTLSKQALAEATRSLAIALAPRVRVNGVAPGLILPTDDYAPGQVERLAACMPLERHAAPDEIADAVAWLAGARAVTGQTLFVDGGAHLKSFERDFVHLMR